MMSAFRLDDVRCHHWLCLSKRSLCHKLVQVMQRAHDLKIAQDQQCTASYSSLNHGP